MCSKHIWIEMSFLQKLMIEKQQVPMQKSASFVEIIYLSYQKGNSFREDPVLYLVLIPAIYHNIQHIINTHQVG